MAELVLWAKLSWREMSGTHESATIPGVLGFRRPEVFRKNLPE